ncbi:MAG: FecR domain-containing protein [Pseudomonadota bacterium]
MNVTAPHDDRLQQAHDWLLLLEDPDVTANDREAFQRWLEADPQNADLMDQAATFTDALRTLSPADVLCAEPQRPNPRSHRGWNPLRIWGLAAAAAAGFVALTPIALKYAPSSIGKPLAHQLETTSVAETRSLILNDSTQITLGPLSSLSVSYSDDARMLNLERGAAFFDVAPDANRPLIVQAGAVTVRVLGTEFDLSIGGGLTRVAVAEGQVRVSSGAATTNAQPAATRQVLGKGQSIAGDTKGLRAVTPIAAQDVGAWRSKRLVYSSATLAELIDDAARYTATPIEIEPGSEAILDFKIRGAFRTTDVAAILESISLIHPVDVQRSAGGQIVLQHRAN